MACHVERHHIAMYIPLTSFVPALAMIAALAVARNGRIHAGARIWLVIFLLVLAGIGALLGIRLTLESAIANRVQPLLAILLGPSAYLGFKALTEERSTFSFDALGWHVVAIAAAEITLLTTVSSADAVVLVITSAYFVLIARLTTKSRDEFVHVSSTGMANVKFALFATLALFALSIVADLSIILAGLFAGEAALLSFVNLASVVLTGFVFLVALIGTPLLVRDTVGAEFRSSAAANIQEHDRLLFAELNTLMESTFLYRDSDLTLARVGRRMGKPARTISICVNQCTGSNFSRFINNLRVCEAQKVLRETDLPVTEVMLEVGFVTKSNFNAEFKRITGMTPSEFRAGRTSGVATPVTV